MRRTTSMFDGWQSPNYISYTHVWFLRGRLSLFMCSLTHTTPQQPTQIKHIVSEPPCCEIAFVFHFCSSVCLERTVLLNNQEYHLMAVIQCIKTATWDTVKEVERCQWSPHKLRNEDGGHVSDLSTQVHSGSMKEFLIHFLQLDLLFQPSLSLSLSLSLSVSLSLTHSDIHFNLVIYCFTTTLDSLLWVRNVIFLFFLRKDFIAMIKKHHIEPFSHASCYEVQE